MAKWLPQRIKKQVGRYGHPRREKDFEVKPAFLLRGPAACFIHPGSPGGRKSSILVTLRINPRFCGGAVRLNRAWRN